jgi:arsenite methyltransferase
MAAVRSNLTDRHGDYGFDGGSAGALAGAAVGVLALPILALFAFRSGRRRVAMIAFAASAGLTSIVPFYLHATRRGKFLVWAELLEGLHLRGDEQVLDLGCGRGAVLTIVAKLLSHGRIVGLDLWTADQSGNSPIAAQQNLAAEGIAERCSLTTGNMLDLPFADASFDLVVSSLAIHNIDQFWVDNTRRLLAIDEAVRVLKPGGRLVIVDLMWTGAYAQRLRGHGMANVEERRLGWRFWYGPWMGANLVTAVKPE